MAIFKKSKNNNGKRKTLLESLPEILQKQLINEVRELDEKESDEATKQAEKDIKTWAESTKKPENKK